MPELNAALTGSADYLFCRIDKAVADYRAAHPLARLISLGIGDITQPLAPVAAAALRTAAAEMASPAGVRGYGPAGGYPFLQTALAHQYEGLPCPVFPDEITVTAGSKDALGGLFALFSPTVPVWVCDPVYPAYRDCALAAGHRVHTLPCLSLIHI